jgi:hypothetical protein
MDKLSKLFMNQVDVLQKQLENLLEKRPLQKSKPKKISDTFSASQDLSQLDSIGIGLPSEIHARALMVFSRLQPYFESGLLFHNQKTSKAIAAIDHGEFFQLHGTEIQIPFQIPSMNLIEVRKVQSAEIFSQLKEIQVIRSDRSQALIFRPHPEYIFLVTSTLADPWLKSHIELIQTEVLKLLAEDL